jgi:glycerol-3-phosphate dehydrogenase
MAAISPRSQISLALGETMAKEETVDVVIIGAGHNGTTTAARLAYA